MESKTSDAAIRLAQKIENSQSRENEESSKGNPFEIDQVEIDVINRRERQFNKKNIQCFRCRKFGHFAAQCHSNTGRSNNIGERRNYRENKEIFYLEEAEGSDTDICTIERGERSWVQSEISLAEKFVDDQKNGVKNYVCWIEGEKGKSKARLRSRQ